MRILPTLLIASGVVLAAPSLAAADVAFQAPSKNIACRISPDFGARCDIDHHDYANPERPDTCTANYGQAFLVGEAGRPAFVCAGDKVTGGVVLKYGGVKKSGRYKCQSLKSGMKCANLDTGHGFKVDEERYNFF